MTRGAKFWIPMAMFQVGFGLAVFLITRQYFMHEAETASRTPVMVSKPYLAWPDKMETDPALGMPLSLAQSAVNDPQMLARQADEYFNNEQYDLAADLYQQMLDAGSKDVNTYNNLGITLFYLRRPADALKVLNEGVALDSSFQRIWLTLGFVNAQVGATDKARAALTTAIGLGPENEIGVAATKMLAQLPPAK